MNDAQPNDSQLENSTATPTDGAPTFVYQTEPSPWDADEAASNPPSLTAEPSSGQIELPDLKGLAIAPPAPPPAPEVLDLEQQIARLQAEEATLRADVAQLRTARSQLQEQLIDTQNSLGRLIQAGLKELEQRRKTLQIAVEQLERRQERIRKEMQTTFAGVSQDVAIRVQSFKDYLVGSLGELAASAEELNLPTILQPPESPTAQAPAPREADALPRFAEQSFQDQTQLIRSLLDQYRNRPDYYGPSWQLRRTFEPIHAERVANWFFKQAARGAVRTMGGRLQNILVTSAAISILYELYGDRLCTLVLAQSPERLGEWRRGLQDCLGITRSDFGTDRGVALFEDPEALAVKAERLDKEGLIPFIVIDETEAMISLSLLQFPLWLAFAPNPAVQNYEF